MDRIRNFSIIAHIDHGKSTLADRLIQHTGVVTDRELVDQVLDSMDLERERGITIKSQAITLPYRAKDGELYHLDLIDTPGHVDFSYEVSRSLASCEGVLLLVDAAQGVEAQTLANLYLAMEQDLEIVPVINKIDLPSADIERVKEEIERDLGLDPDDAVLCSAKAGTGIEDVLEAIVQRLPPPTGDPEKPLSALVFDAQYDTFRGVIVHVRLFDGEVRAGDEIRFLNTGVVHKVDEVGRFKLQREKADVLSAGEVGYLIGSIKTVRDASIGDTITLDSRRCEGPQPGFKDVKPYVFSSIYPVASDDYPALRDALERYQLNDAALVYQKDSSVALGQGFRCGFLGLLHLEIVQQRLEREYDLFLVFTAPSVLYRLELTNGETVEIDNPAHFPDPATIERTEEPYVKSTIMIPDRYLGSVMTLCRERRGIDKGFHYISPQRVELHFELPLSEVIFDFYDRLKTITQGYGSFDYDLSDYRESRIALLDILVNGEKVDALSQLVFKDTARTRALHACERLKEEIPRHMFKIAIQGAIGGTIIARTTINAFRKDVTAKCYGGDVTRKRKLLEAQKRGKKRMKMVGQVSVPQKAFLAVLKSKDD